MNERIAKRAAWVVAFSASLSACAARSGVPTPARTVEVRRIQGPYVLAGTEFDVEFEQPLGADANRPGDAFVARVTTPLKAPNGKDVVPAGARVTGRVVDAVGVGGSALALRFESIETVRGSMALHATVESAGFYASVAPIPQMARPPEGAQIDALLRPPRRAIGGGPLEPGMRVLPPVRIPAGGAVHMALLESMIPPGVNVEVPPREFVVPQAPPYKEPPYKSLIVVPSDPTQQVSP